jgi:peptidoglycan/LPS O-acetylase OafA/YrhL
LRSGWDAVISRLGVYTFQAWTAVMVFFVISGFVLSESLLRTRPTYLQFVVRRMLRLYPTALCGLMVGVLYVALVPNRVSTAATSWFTDQFLHDVSNTSLWRNFLLIDWDFNGPLWSIHVEIGAALLLPIMVGLRRRLGGSGQLALFVGLVALSYLDVPRVLKYLFCFYPGLYVRSHGAAVTRPMFLLALAGLVLVEAAQIADRLAFAHKTLLDVLLGYVVVCYAVHKARWRVPLLQWLGDLSFSFYVIHFPIMHAVAILTLANLTIAPLAVHALVVSLSCPCALLIAWPVHALIERPTMLLSRRVGLSRPLTALSASR